jgi:hypothetical protein
METTMNWLQAEESKIRMERRAYSSSNKLTWVMMALIVSIAGINYLQSEDYIACPHCEGIIEVEVGAKRIPGAGYECDNCHKFYVHGDRCPYCRCKKTE